MKVGGCNTTPYKETVDDRRCSDHENKVNANLHLQLQLCHLHVGKVRENARERAREMEVWDVTGCCSCDLVH